MKDCTALFNKIYSIVFFYKTLFMKDLRQLSLIGLGLLCGPISLAALHSFTQIKVTGYTHRPSTCIKARKPLVSTNIVDCLKSSLSGVDLVFLATPLNTFEKIFIEISDSLPSGCIITDVGSTKMLAHRLAAIHLQKRLDI